MTWVICKTGDLGPGHTTVSIGLGEAYLSAAITEQLQVALDQAISDRVRVAVRQFKAA